MVDRLRGPGSERGLAFRGRGSGEGWAGMVRGEEQLAVWGLVKVFGALMRQLLVDLVG